MNIFQFPYLFVPVIVDGQKACSGKDNLMCGLVDCVDPQLSNLARLALSYNGPVGELGAHSQTLQAGFGWQVQWGAGVPVYQSTRHLLNEQLVAN